MKRLLLVSLAMAALPLLAIESPKNPTDAPLPRSVFEKVGRDPFAHPEKKKVETTLNESPVYALTLNGILGSRALISGKSLAEGESAIIKSGNASIKVVCKEIRKDEVLVQVGTNSQIELHFKAKLNVDEQGVLLPK